MRTKDITPERVRELLFYDPETGIFRWRVSRSHLKAGVVAGSPDKRGYIRIGIDRAPIFAHRAAWAYMHGHWPSLIDHIDGNIQNNVFSNLRIATYQQNSRNHCGKGYYRVPSGKFQAYIYVDYKQIPLGIHPTEEQARAAYLAASKIHFGEFSQAYRGGGL